MSIDVRRTVERFLPRSRFFRNVSIVTGGASLGQGLVLLVSPILTRLYTPEEFGILAVYISFQSILMVISCLKYEMAIPVAASDRDAKHVFIISLIAAGVVGAIVFLAVLSAGDAASLWLGIPEIAPYLYFLPVGVFAIGIHKAFNYWALRFELYPIVARTKLSQSIAMVVSQVGLGFAKAGAAGLIIGEIIGRAGGIIRYYRAYLARKPTTSGGVTMLRLKRNARRFIKFPLISTWSGLLNSIGSHVAPILVASFYGPTVAGLFALTNRVMASPVALIGMSFSQVFVGEAAKNLRTDPARVMQLFSVSVKKLFFYSFIPLVALTLLAPYYFPIVFGPQWGEAGRYAALLVIFFIAQFTIGPLTHTLNILERQGLQLFWDIARAASVVGVLLLGGLLAWPPAMTIFAYGIVMSLCYAAMGVLVYSVLRKLNRSGDAR